MQKVFKEVGTLDIRCYEQFGLSEDILMEHAATSMQNFIEDIFDDGSSVLIVSGVGNNGADGIALARLLHKKYNISLFTPFGVKSQMAKLQLKRAEYIGIEPLISYNALEENYDVVVDCLFGSGLSRELDKNSITIIEKLNLQNGYKLSCDIPSGINKNGQIDSVAFFAHTTITMGALKRSLFSDGVKDHIGEIIVADLGVQRDIYEVDSECFLLDLVDMKLPNRKSKNTHKGTFGHLAVITGQKEGAGILSAQSGFALGAGLVSIVAHEKLECGHHIMQSHQIPSNTTAIALGMGLGAYDIKEIKDILNNDIAKVIDADLFYEEDILNALDKDNVVLTPHPKEFCSLLKICGFGDIDIKTLQSNRFEYVEKFCNKYPNVILLLKGSNVLIGKDENIYINPHGTNKLSFGGSGDVLSGFIASLLAQGYTPLDAAISGSLIHSKVALEYKGSDFSMSPYDLIDGVKYL